MAVTSAAVAFLASAWLVPPYLALAIWIMLPSHGERGDAPRRTVRSGRQRQATAVESNGTVSEAGGTPPSEPATESTTPAESLADEAGSLEPAPSKGKRGRGRGRKAKTLVDAPPSNATWIQVGPGKYVRVETSSPMVAHLSPQAPEVGTAEDTGQQGSLATGNSLELKPPAPEAKTAPAVEVPNTFAEPPLSVVEAAPADVAPAPGVEEALPPPIYGPVADDEPALAQIEEPGIHPDELHEVERVADDVSEDEDEAEDAGESVDDHVPVSDESSEAWAELDEVSEKLGIAPEASAPEPSEDHDAPLADDTADDARQLESELASAHEPPARPTDILSRGTFHESWSGGIASAWSPGASPTWRGVRTSRSTRSIPGFRQRSGRSMGRTRESCRAFPPRAPPSGRSVPRGRRRPWSVNVPRRPVHGPLSIFPASARGIAPRDRRCSWSPDRAFPPVSSPPEIRANATISPFSPCLVPRFVLVMNALSTHFALLLESAPREYSITKPSASSR